MEITLLYFEGCPSWRIADERLNALAAERDDIRVTHRLVRTPAEAERTGFHGSPSILVDGVDVFAEPGAQVVLACRRYPTPDGFEGAPTLEQLRTALADVQVATAHVDSSSAPDTGATTTTDVTAKGSTR